MQYIFLRQARLFLASAGTIGVLAGLPFAVSAAVFASVDLEREWETHLFISDADQAGLDISGDMTLEAWVKLESAPPVGESYAIMSKSAGDVNDAGFDFVYQTGASGGKFTLGVSANGFSGTNCTIPHTLPLGEWHHAAVTYRAGAGVCEVFVDGARVGSSGGLAGRIHKNGAPFRVGARGHTPMFFFDGLIDDVRVWSVARSAGEIAASFGMELSGAEEHLAGYWTLNGDALDISASGNHLTIDGDVVFSHDTPFGADTENGGASPALAVRQSDHAPIGAAIPAVPAGAGDSENGDPVQLRGDEPVDLREDLNAAIPAIPAEPARDR